MVRISIRLAHFAGIPLVALLIVTLGASARAEARQTDHPPSTPALSAAKAKAKACRRGQTRLRLKGRTQCISSRTLFRGQPKGTAALASRIVGFSRRLDAGRGGTSITALLGADAPAIAAWEDAVATAGLSETDRRLTTPAPARAHTRQSGGEESLGLPTLDSLREYFQSGSTDVDVERKSGLQNNRERATVKASLSGKGTNYQFELDETKPQGVYCPDKKGQVTAFGGVKARRDAVRDGQQVTEGFNADYTVVGNVDASGTLKSYDIIVTWENATGTVRGIKPTAVGVPIIDAKSIDIKWSGGRSKDLEFGMAEVMRYAQEQARRHLDNAEDEWNNAASCIRVVPTPKVVKAGTTATVTIKAFSKVTGKAITADLALEPGGGAKVSPARTKTSPASPGKSAVTMPKTKGKRAHIAAAAKVAVTARSPQGVGRASIGTNDLPEAYDVALDLDGRGIFATHEATGTLNATWRAASDGTGRWAGGTSAVWANLAVTSKIDDCSYDTPVAGTGPVAVTVVANDRGDAVTVTFDYGTGTAGFASVLQSTFTVRCSGDPPPPPIPGQPGPSLVGVGPTSFTLPITGGAQPLLTTSEVQSGGDGFFTTGTLRLTPVGP